MTILAFQELFEPRIKYYFNVRLDSYVATLLKTISLPPFRGYLHLKYSFAFKKARRKTVDCYTTYGLD